MPIENIIEILKAKKIDIIKCNYVIIDYLTQYSNFIKYQGKTLKIDNIFLIGEIADIKVFQDPEISIIDKKLYNINNEIVLELYNI